MTALKLRYFCLIWVCAAVATGDVCAQTISPLKPVGKPAKAFTLSRGKQPGVSIQISALPTSQEIHAAAELQHWLREMSGVLVPIATNQTRGPGLLIRTVASLGDEGYRISRSGRGLLVLEGGSTRGVLNAVYALLEEDLGCRFYTKDFTLVPRTNTLVLAPVPRTYVPRLRIRDPFYACAFDADWSLRNRANAPNAPVPESKGGRIDYANMFVHTAGQILPPDKYFASHPEYFALQADGKRVNTQLCPTHPEVVKIAVDYVRSILRDNPSTEIVSVSKNDCVVSCLCHTCKALRDQEGSDMANQLFLINNVAQAIEKDYPALAIDTLAYLETIQVPKTVRPRKNVVIRLCNDSVGAWSHPFTPAEHCEVARLASAWSAVHDRIYIWDYTVNFSHYLAPMPNLDVIAANIRFWVRNKAEGVMLQGGYQGPAERDQLKCWVAAKLLWNPDWDESVLAADFIKGYYGKAATALMNYESLLQDARDRFAKEMAAPVGGIRYGMDAPLFTRDFIRRANEIFSRARAMADTDSELLRRIERAELPVLYVQCVRGPSFTGENYVAIVDRFEHIARREKIQFLQEGGPDFDSKLASFRSRITSGQ